MLLLSDSGLCVTEMLDKQHGIKVAESTLQSFLKATRLSLKTGSHVVEEQARPESICHYKHSTPISYTIGYGGTVFI